MIESLVPLLEHCRCIFERENRTEIVQSCKASVLSVFLSAIMQEHTDVILSRIIKIIKDFKLTSDNEMYFTKAVCSTPPTNHQLMIWLLNNIRLEYLDQRALCLEMCLRKWTDLLHLLKKDNGTSGIDLTCVIKELCRSGKYEVVKWLVEKIKCSIRSKDAKINIMKDDSIQWLLENVDKSTFNMQTAINEICTTGNIHIVQWFMQNYNAIAFLDMKTVLNESCRAGNIWVATWIIENTDKSLLDINAAILAACHSKRHDVLTLLVDSLDPFSFDMNILLRMCHEGQNFIVSQLLRIVRHFALPEVVDCARKACKQDKLKIVQWLIKTLNSKNYINSNRHFDMKSALNEAFQGEEEKPILEFLLQNMEHKQFNIETAIEAAIRENKFDIVQTLLKNDAYIAFNVACRSTRIDIIQFILESVKYTHLDISTMQSVLMKSVEFNKPDITKYVLDKYDHSVFDMRRLFTTASFKGRYEIIDMLLTSVDHKLFDMIEAMNAALNDISYDEFPEIGLQVAQLLLKTINPSLLDIMSIRTILHRACRNGEFDKVKLLVQHFDNKTLDMKTAMNCACSYGNVDIVNFIAGVVDHLLFDLTTAMSQALSTSNLKIMKLLTDIGDNTLLGIDIAMNDACSRGNLNVVQLLVENVDNALFDRKKVMNLACIKDNCRIVKLLTEKGDPTLLCIDTAMNEACSRNCLNVVQWLVENIDNELFDKKRVMKFACINNHCKIIKLLIEKGDHSLLIIDTAMNETCLTGRLNVFQWLVENIDNALFDKKRVMKFACIYDNCQIVKLLIEKGDNSLLCIDTAMNEACSTGNLNVVKWLLENFDNALFDRKGVMNLACIHGNYNIMKFLIKKWDTTVLGIDIAMNDACSKGNINVVLWLVKNVDNALFDVKHVKTSLDCVTDNVLRYVVDDDKLDTINFLLNQFEAEYIFSNMTKLKQLMCFACFKCDLNIAKTLTDKVDSSLLGIDTIIYKACEEGDLGVVKWIVENFNKTLFDINTALDNAIGDDFDDEDYCNFNISLIHFLLRRLDAKEMLSNTQFKVIMGQACLESRLGVVQLLTEKVNNTLLGFDKGMCNACSNVNTDVVEWLVANVDEALLDINTAIGKVLSRSDGLDLAVWLLENVPETTIDMNTHFINACSTGDLDVLKILLEHCGSQVLDVKTALNESCLNGHFDLVLHIFERFDNKHLDLNAAMIKVCRCKSKNNVGIANYLWNKLNHNLFDVAKAMNNACRYGNLKIAIWLFESNDADLFDMSEALCSACQYDMGLVVKWIVSNIPAEKINVQKAIKNTCRNNSDDLFIIKCFVESSDKMNLDLNILIKEACTYERTDIIKWMLSHCDKYSFRILDLMTSLVCNDTSPQTFVSDRKCKSKHDSNIKQKLILKILKDSTLVSFDYNSILCKASVEGWIDIFKWIIMNIDNDELLVMNAVNIASKNGRCDIINWSLSNLNTDQIDANTILAEASGFGWIEVVKNIFSRPLKSKLNLSNAMNDACAFGRVEIVSWLLENNAKDVFDLSAVMNAACINGWTDTLNWILKNTDHMLLDMDCAVTEACAAGNIKMVQVFFNTFGNIYFNQQKLSTRICEKSENEKVVLFLLQNLNAAGFQIDNILIKASGFGWLGVVCWIMECNPEINTFGAAFENACVNGEIDIVKCLQDKTSQDNIQTGLRNACKSGFEEIVEVLLECVKHEHFDMATVLNEACRCGEHKVVELLLKKVDNALFDKRAAITEACKSKLPEDLVYFLIEDLQNIDFDYEVVSENARKHRWNNVLMQLKRKP